MKQVFWFMFKWTIIIITLTMVGVVLVSLAYEMGYARGTGSRPDVYELWRVSPDAPLSVRFKGTCIEAEDSAAHLKLVEYSTGEVVYGCQRRGY